jgi:hypothetical protein
MCRDSLWEISDTKQLEKSESPVEHSMHALRPQVLDAEQILQEVGSHALSAHDVHFLQGGQPMRRLGHHACCQKACLVCKVFLWVLQSKEEPPWLDHTAMEVEEWAHMVDRVHRLTARISALQGLLEVQSVALFSLWQNIGTSLVYVTLPHSDKAFV